MGGVENRAGQITQLGFDSLADVSTRDDGSVPPGRQAGIATVTSDVAVGSKREVYRSAPPSRSKAKKRATKTYGIQQATLDELFAAPPDEEPETQSQSAAPQQGYNVYEHN